MTAIAHRPHPVSRVLEGVRGQLTDVAGMPVWSMDATETTTAIAEVQAAEAQLAEVKARLLSHAKRIDIAGASAASSTATWHAATTRCTRMQAHRAMRLAEGLESRDLTRAALAEGRVQVEQAEVILRVLTDLPTDLDADLVEKAEAQLLDQAQHFDAKALKVLGRRILEITDPDAAAAHEAALLEREERAAQVATRLTAYEDGHGTVHGTFTTDTLTWATLKKALYAIASPKHQASKGPLGESRPTPERLGQAFVDYVRRYPAKRLPKTGGLNATAVVLIPLETLMGGLRAAHLDTGETTSPGAARRLACQARILPAVLGTDSQVLDLGRASRFYNEGQRIAKTIEAGGCEVDGCDWPPGMTDMHHPTRWADGGETNRDGIMLCPPHHHRAHDTRYQMTRQPNGKIAFHRRT